MASTFVQSAEPTAKSRNKPSEEQSPRRCRHGAGAGACCTGYARFLITLTARVVSSEPTPPSNHAMLDGTLRWACAAVGAAGEGGSAGRCSLCYGDCDDTSNRANALSAHHTPRVASRQGDMAFGCARATDCARAGAVPAGGCCDGRAWAYAGVNLFLGALVCPIDMEKSGGVRRWSW